MLLEVLPQLRLGIKVPASSTLATYAAGSGTPQATYADYLGATPNANPVVAGADGLFPPIFLLPLPYKFTLHDPAGGQTDITQDHVAASNYSLLFDDVWILKDNADPTKKFGFQASGITTATTRILTVPDLDGTLALLTGAQTLDAKTLTAVAGIAMNGRILGKQVTVSAANNLTLGAGNCNLVNGTTQINLLDTTGWVNGSVVQLIFSNSVTVKTGITASTTFQTISLAGAVDFAATNLDTLTLMMVNGAWAELGRSVN